MSTIGEMEFYNDQLGDNMSELISTKNFGEYISKWLIAGNMTARYPTLREFFNDNMTVNPMCLIHS